MRMETWQFEGISIEYELFVPESAGEMLPLLVFFPRETGDVPKLRAFLTGEGFQKKHPCGVLIPVSPCGAAWTEPGYAQALQRLVFHVRWQHWMDLCRTYLAGYAQGAAAVWHMLAHYPRVFAGGVAAAGCGDPYAIRQAKYAPVYAFHAADDDVVSVAGPTKMGGKRFLAGSRRMIAALRTAGGELARYTEYPQGGHEIGERVFSDDATWQWLFSQDRRKVFWVEFVRPGLYRIDDYFMSSCYLIEGKDRALLIDTGLAEGDLAGLLAKLTRLPVDLAITHPHIDHMYHVGAFERVYMPREDAEKIKDIYADMRMTRISRFQNLAKLQWPCKEDPAAEVIALDDGDVIDLGEVQVEMANACGHTTNHVVYIDRTNHCVFTGDAIGSGFVVGVNYPKGKLKETYIRYRENLRALIRRVSDGADYVYFGGHFIQENSCDDPMQEDYLSGQSTYFVPLSEEVLFDMEKLCGKIIEEAENLTINPTNGEFVMTCQSASLCGRWLE